MMTNKDAWLYAATWGSFNTAGDPGACLYGFDEAFRVQSEEHRADCIAEMERNRATVEAGPESYDPDELAQIDALIVKLREAPAGGAPDPLDGCDEFTAGYIEAIFFAECDHGAETGREYLAKAEDPDGNGTEGSFPASASAGDLSAAALATIKADCEAFQTKAAGMLAEAAARGYSAARAGLDFWLTRNGHGAGFWDREELEPQGAEWGATRIPLDRWTPAIRATRERLKAESLGQRLSKAAQGFGEVYLSFGGDGRIHA
jgi:hypothetical protein